MNTTMANPIVLNELDPINIVSPQLQTAVMAYYIIIAIVGVCGNALTILSILLNKKLKSIPNLYVCNLAVADIIVCGAIAPFSAWVFMNDHQTLGAECTVVGALNAALLGKTMYGLTAIAINRYVLVVKGTETYTRLYTRRNVILSIVSLWTLSILLILPATVGFGEFGYNVKMGACIFIAYDSLTYIYVQAILHGLCVGPCVLITTYCYIRIIWYFRKTQNRLNRYQNPSKTDQTNKQSLDDTNKIEDYDLSSSGPSANNAAAAIQVRQKRTRASKRVVMNLCTIFAVFLLCWLPIVSVFTIDFYNQAPASISHIFFAIAVTNSCLNVFIYAGMNSAFRKSYKQILTCNYNKMHFGL